MDFCLCSTVNFCPSFQLLSFSNSFWINWFNLFVRIILWINSQFFQSNLILVTLITSLNLDRIRIQRPNSKIKIHQKKNTNTQVNLITKFKAKNYIILSINIHSSLVTFVVYYFPVLSCCIDLSMAAPTK